MRRLGRGTLDVAGDGNEVVSQTGVLRRERSSVLVNYGH